MADNRLKRSVRATFLGMVTNAILACGKLAAGILGHSHALVADAVESFADIFSSVIVWRGMVLAAEPADEEHPYGHGKAEPLAAAVVCGFLLAAAGWIAFEAIHQLSGPRPPPEKFTLWVLIAVIVVKEGLFRFVLHEALSIESSAVQADAWHHRSDAITSLAAAIGIIVAIFAGIRSADDVAAIFAAVIIAANGLRLLRPALNELMDRSPNQEVIEQIRKLGASISGVQRVEKCLVRQAGYHYFVDMHVEVDPQMTVLRSHQIAHEVKDKVREQIPRVRDVLVHIEPTRELREDRPKVA
jgi:cation diffusion facilitator family transporter